MSVKTPYASARFQRQTDLMKSDFNHFSVLTKNNSFYTLLVTPSDYLIRVQLIDTTFYRRCSQCEHTIFTFSKSLDFLITSEVCLEFFFESTGKKAQVNSNLTN